MKPTNLLNFVTVRDWLLKQDGNAVAHHLNNGPIRRDDLKISLIYEQPFITCHSQAAYCPSMRVWILHPAHGYILTANFEQSWNRFVHSHRLWEVGLISNDGRMRQPAYYGDIRTRIAHPVHSVTSLNDFTNGPSALCWKDAPSSIGTFGNTVTFRLFEPNIYPINPTEIGLFRKGWYPVQAFDDVLTAIREGDLAKATGLYQAKMNCTREEAEEAVKASAKSMEGTKKAAKKK